MLLILTPNPAIDRLLVAPGFRATDSCRVTEVRDAAGGKGLNVARAARSLGVPVRVVAPLAGAAGRTLDALAAAEGIDARWCWLATGETRTCTLAHDLATRDTLALNERGPTLDASSWGAFASLARAQAPEAGLVASSGSLPPGVAAADVTRLLRDLMGMGVPVALDTSGPMLAAALALPLDLLKVNIHELAEALGAPLNGVAEAQAAARQVLATGPKAVMITLGPLGAVLASAEGAWHAQPPSVEALSPIGSGDATMAGVAAALLRGEDHRAALRLGVACGTANTLVLGPGVVRPEDVERLAQATVVERVS